MLKIWGRSNSNNVKKVLWCAEELSLPYERLEAGGPFGVVDTAEFGEMNPNRRVPVLQDRGATLWESNAIVRYLAAQYGGPTFYPPDAVVRAAGDRWMDWASITFGAPFVTIFWNLKRASPEQRNVAAVNAAIESAAEMLQIVDAALKEAPFLSGGEFGPGDIPLGCLIHAWFNLDIPRPDHRHLARWYDRLLARPAYEAVVALPLT